MYSPCKHSPCVAHVRSAAVVGALVSHWSPLHCRTAVQAPPVLAAEKVAPSSHAAHWRSAVAVPAADWPSPTRHVANVAQLSTLSVPALAPALNVPEAQGAHTTSLLAVAAAVVRVPAAHDELTVVHSVPLFSVENVEPGTHAAHWRSAVALPSAARPLPTGHVAQAAHAERPTSALKVPSAHAAHTRSLVVVAYFKVYVPMAHGGLTALHAAPLISSEYVAPATQPEHCRSPVADPATVSPWPAGQRCQVTQIPDDGLDLN